MSETSQASPAGTALRIHFAINLKSLSWLVAVALLVCGLQAKADDRDDEYLRIFNLMQDADSLNTSGQTDKALTKYQQALTALRKFQKSYPDWNAKTVAYRLNYLVGKINTRSEKGSVPAQGTAATGAKEVSPGTKTANGAPMPQVKLLEAGAEPRKVLRLHPKAGDKETLSMVIKMAMDMKIGEMENPAMKMPAMKITLDVAVKSVSPDGDISYDMVFSDASVTDDPDVMPQVAEAIKSQFAGIKGLSGTGTISHRGFNKGIDIKVPAGADPQMRQTMEQMKESLANVSAPLPEEAIGPGGKWEVKMPIKSQGMSINQTAVYEVVSIEDDQLSAKSTFTQEATNQKMQNPAMPGMKIDLLKMTAKGSGDRTFDLTKILPSKGTVDFHSDSSMAMDMGGQKQGMTMKMDMNIRLEGK